MQKSTQRFCKGTTMFFCVILPSSLFAQSYKGLADKVSLNMEHATAVQVVKSLEKQTKYSFTYDPEYLQACTLSNLRFKDSKLEDVLSYMDIYAPLDIEFSNNAIALRKGRQEKKPVEEKGRISGKVVDNKNEPLPGVTIIAENGPGVVSNVDGTYELNLSPGIYNLTFSYISYETRKVTEITVKNKENVPLDIVLKSEGSRLKGVTVTANYKRASVEGLYAIQKNNSAITDGISAEQISRTPDKNIGEVLKRVSGLATVDNKYVVVRGLSERYNQAVLNGQVMPSTELNRKNFSFDLIPSNIVDNVTVVKTLTPDRNAEFGGGLVEVNTLDIPVNNFLNIGVGGSVNSNTTNKNFRSLELDGSEYRAQAAPHRNLLGKLDWSNTKDVIAAYNAGGKNPRMFSNNWGLYDMNASPSQNYQLSAGRAIRLSAKDQLGVILALSYRNTFATQDIRMSRDGFEGSSEGEQVSFNGKRYGFTTNLGGMFGIGYRNEKLRLSYQAMYLRMYDQQLVFGKGAHANPSATLLGYYDLTTQTALTQHQLKGEYALGNKGVKLKWLGAYINLDRNKPDNHQFKADIIESDYLATNDMNISNPFSNGINAGALRLWSRAFEKNYTWDVSASIPFKLFNWDHTFKTGYGGWSKDRLFYVLNTGSQQYNTQDFPPISKTFIPERGGQIVVSQFADDFDKTANLHAVYGMFDNKFGEKLRLVWGLRAEYYNMNNVNALLDSTYSDAVKDRDPNWRLFPSANLTYSLTSKMNLRLAYANSIIRPDLRELSYFSEYDFELGGQYHSALVRSTLVRHLDFRYEYYPGPGEILSLSLFHKEFKHPMEIYKEGDNRSYKLANNASATNLGLEIEMRKTLAFTKVPVLKNVTLYGNFTALDAKVKQGYSKTFTDPATSKLIIIDSVGRTEKRPQTGASNYMVNAGIYYDTKPFSLSLVYNYVTNRMFRPSEFYRESLFERPIQALDGQVAFRFLKQKAEVRLAIANLLDSYNIVYRNFYADGEITNGRKDPSIKDLLYQKGKDQIDYEARPGRTYSATLSYSF
ncbi:TonB-dependent receptor [Chitinophaga niabensis]|uniref:TonB-dependent receptor n=1 Tax=Chitinophaga niabensis TaxID=536979 RepID=UPI0031B9C1C3